MTHRERVFKAFAHEEANRVPMDLGGSLASTMVSEAYTNLRRELGLELREEQCSLAFASTAEIDEDVGAALDVDIVHAPRAFGTSDDVEILSDGRLIDEWGVTWHKPEHGHYYVERAPFAESSTPAIVDRHAWRGPAQMVQLDGLVERIETLRSESDCAISLEVRGRVISVGQFLCGFEKWLMDLLENESFVQALLERTTQIQIEANDRLLRAVGHLVDIVYTSDDLGGQNGPLISPDCFGRLFKPHFARIWRHLRETTPAKLVHHCCGSIYPFIPHFIELGVEGLNPIQVSASDMDPTRLKTEFGRDLCFWGGVDTRDVMPRGGVDDVRQECGRRIRQMGRGGGYILAAVHNIQPEVPAANVRALFDAGVERVEFGRRSDCREAAGRARHRHGRHARVDRETAEGSTHALHRRRPAAEALGRVSSKMAGRDWGDDTR